MWVYDDPMHSRYYVQLPPFRPAHASTIRASVENVLRFEEKRPAESVVSGRTGASIHIQALQGGDSLWGVGNFSGGFMPRQIAWIRDHLIILWQDKDAAYLSVELSKGYAGFGTPLAYIAERFPPLADRVADWSKDRLLEELGQGGSMARTI